ncbi:MAG: choice-of-anchor J domain-containing protein [Prevotella sp.]
MNLNCYKWVWFLLCMPLLAAAQETYLDVSFSNGIPASFIQVDRDGNQPSADMQALGFSVGKGWIDYVVEKDNNNRVACSTSWYESPASSDDWLILPAFTVKSPSDILRWRAMAYDRRFRDGYAVYVSTSGTDVTSFDTSAPLFSIAEEEASWTTRSVSLAAYTGKQVNIAFVNNSKDKSRLYIDDIFAGSQSAIYMSLSLPEVIDYAGEVYVSGEVYTADDTPVEGFTVSFEYGGQTVTQHFVQVLKAGERVPFTLSQPITVSNNSRVEYRAAVSNGETSYVAGGTLTALRHKHLVEESTGTWCGWCVRGIVAMEKLASEHGDRFVGVAIHNNDVMTDEAYDEQINAVNPGGFPKLIVNRDKSITGDPLYMDGHCRQAEAAGYPLTGLDVCAAYSSGDSRIDVRTDVYFPSDADDVSYRLAYALIENDVYQPDNNEYYQNNAYFDGLSGVMGGYENKPQYIPAADMHYQEVARGYFGDFFGIEGSVPSTVRAMEPATHNYSFLMPQSVIRADHAEVVVMLIDRSNRVVNVEKTALQASSSSIASVSDGTGLRLEMSGGNIMLYAAEPVTGVRVVSASGQVVRTLAPQSESVCVSSNGLKGVYFLTIVSGNSKTVRKIMF